MENYCVFSGTVKVALESLILLGAKAPILAQEGQVINEKFPREVKFAKGLV